jgi:hypothetical protein
MKIFSNEYTKMAILMFSFGCSDNKEKYHYDDNSISDSTYLNFAERTNNIFGLGCYPLYAPFKEGSCAGFQLYFNRYTNISDTIKGVINIKDDNKSILNYKVVGGDEYSIIKNKGDEIYLFPKVEGVSGYYSYTFILEKESKPQLIKLVTTENDTILLYEKGDKILDSVNSICY